MLAYLQLTTPGTTGVVFTNKISGIVDALVRDFAGHALAIAEVKGDGRSSLWQLLAAMDTITSFQPVAHWDND